MPTFQTRKLRFLHVPKTGGWWVEAVVEQLEPITCYCINPHGPHTWGDQSLFSFGFVRDPITWYPSLYRYHERKYWTEWPEMSGLSFEAWKLKYMAGNSYGAILDFQIGIPPVVDFVGRFENLERDTFKALLLAGYDRASIAAVIESTPVANTSY